MKQFYPENFKDSRSPCKPGEGLAVPSLGDTAFYHRNSYELIIGGLIVREVFLRGFATF
jgi:hypothetical protein